MPLRVTDKNRNFASQQASKPGLLGLPGSGWVCWDLLGLGWVAEKDPRYEN